MNKWPLRRLSASGIRRGGALKNGLCEGLCCLWVGVDGVVCTLLAPAPSEEDDCKRDLLGVGCWVLVINGLVTTSLGIAAG